ncbi:MAG TPA: SRPBCC family protein [Solirubrobacterales bacterium]|jgi:hypothetical protein|nr:SRPBCC family protein [Solirubrobacterales bacterium]
MASIRKEIQIDARPEDVWDALRDWGAIHERLVPGFAVDARLDGADRIVTFFNSTELREILVDRDEEARLVGRRRPLQPPQRGGAGVSPRARRTAAASSGPPISCRTPPPRRPPR